ncbi:Alpha/Beta hydrolase protein [Phakopsora pachyrhizi]|uniref:Alpha/Beta hydrolase protein n=1 Tax=Phakopsora pachyrhizi TaxID=170000 RepID=A0AAV0AGS3_PHAPC|nr:Alpha/Beta hydrolase protein [Phakopsora pachyrhizi]
MKYRTQQERRSAKTVLDRLPGSLGHFSVPYQQLKLPVGFSDVNSVRSLLIAFGSRAFSLTTNLLKNQEHIGQPKFPCVEQNHACSINLMRLRDGSHSSAQNEVPGVYGIGTDYGQSLSRFNLAYETWGILSSAKDNVILLHIALSASSHAKSHDLNKSFGWWEKFIGHGPNYPIDLNWYFVICTNVLGSCYGSTGPSSINPETNEPMGPISQSSQSLTRVGSSMGGMQSIVTAWLEPQRVQSVLSISGCWKNRKSLSTPSFSNLQHLQKRLSSLLSWTAEPVSNLIKLKPINDSNNVQNQCLRFNARRPLKENRRSGKLLMEEVDQEHCISLNED